MEELIAELATSLRDAGDEREKIAAAFSKFIELGFPICNSPSALWEFVGTALRRAGLDATEQDRRLRIYSTVSHARFGSGRPLPPDWPWHES